MALLRYRVPTLLAGQGRLDRHAGEVWRGAVARLEAKRFDGFPDAVAEISEDVHDRAFMSGELRLRAGVGRTAIA